MERMPYAIPPGPQFPDQQRRGAAGFFHPVRASGFADADVRHDKINVAECHFRTVV